MANRSVQTALRDTASICELLKVKPSELVAVNVFGYDCKANIHVKPAAFVRIFNSVPTTNRDLSFDKQGNMHAKFTYRRTLIVTVIGADSTELAALMRSVEKIDGQRQRRITASVVEAP